MSEITKEQARAAMQAMFDASGEEYGQEWTYGGHIHGTMLFRNDQLQDFKMMVTKEILPVEHKYFPWFIDKAHEAGAKIHGLGYTNLKGLYRYHFDSVDSTSWLYGNRGGFVYRFRAWRRWACIMLNFSRMFLPTFAKPVLYEVPTYLR